MEDQAKTKAQLIAELNELREQVVESRSDAEEQDQLLGQVMDSVPEGVIVCGRDLRYRFWNRFMEEMTGVPASKILGQRPQEVFPFLREVGVIDKLDQALAGMVPVPTEHAYSVPESGRSGWASDESSPLRNEDGEIIGAIAIVRDITERKEAENALRESQEELAEIFAMSLDLVCISDINESKFLKVNPAFTRVLGYDEGDLLGHSIFEFLHPDDIEPTSKVVEDELKRGKEVMGFANRYRCKDGTWCWLEWTSHPLPERDVTFAVAHDVTERRKADMELAAEYSFRKGVIDGVAEGLCVCHAVPDYPHVAFTLWNERMETITGYSMEEINARGWYQTMYPDPETRQRAVERMSRMREGVDIIGEEWTITRVDGGKRTVSISTSLLQTGNGESHVLALMQDITERKQSEAALRERETQLQATLEATADGILAVDNSGKVLHASRRFAELWGIPQSLLERGDDQALLDFVLGQLTDPDAFLSKVQSLYGSDAVDMDALNFKDGRLFERYSFPMILDGVRTGRVWSFRDVTEHKLLEERLRQSEKMDAIGQLAGGVAHDFNNQLGGIMNYADLLLSKTDDEELRPFIDGIIRLCTRSGKLTNQLLAFSRKGQYQVVPVSIHRVAGEVVSMLGHSIDRRIQIRQRLDANPPTTTGDPTQLQNALLNLGLNARDAMPEGGELVFATDTVALDEEHCRNSSFELMPGEYVRIKVTDSGAGMDEETRSKIFEPFFTTKEQGKGTGMGLAAVFGTVVNHRGAIEVESEIGRGTTMTVYLPLSREEPREAEAGGRVAAQAATESAGAGILVVDDEEVVRECTARMLRRKGYRVATCKDGAEAVDYYRKSWQHIDLVILDMNMPVMNGHDAFIAMRGINAGIRAMLATGYSLDDNAQKILDEGALSYLQKPFRIDELVVQIERALGG